jgi:hypothetical protein
MTRIHSINPKMLIAWSSPGFERDAVLNALRMTGNNRDAAANRLMGGN